MKLRILVVQVSSLITWVNQMFCNILLSWGIIWQLLPSLWKWQTTLDWDDKLIWYSQSATFMARSIPLESMVFRPTWPVKVFATWSSAYCFVINWTFTFCTTNIFGCLYDVMAQFKLIKVICSRVKLHCMFIFVAFIPQME